MSKKPGTTIRPAASNAGISERFEAPIERKIDAVTDIVIRGGKIRSIGASNLSDIPAFDAAGLIVVPGFFDIHVHLREPGTEEAETIATGGSAAAAGGFTAVAAMPNTKPPNDDPSITHYIISEARR